MPRNVPSQRDDIEEEVRSRWPAEPLAAAGACAWSWDATTRRVEWSPGSVSIVGSAPATLEALGEVVHADDIAARAAAVSGALAAGGTWTCAFRLASGSEARWIEERGRAWLDGPGGRPARAAALLLDVTARKLAEESLERDLRRESSEGRAAQAALGEAEAAVARLRELHEHREDVARMIAHDLRTPLGVILAQAKLLGRRNEGTNAVRTRGETIAASAQRMAAMLNDLVESTLLEAGKLRLELAPLDLVALVRELRARLATPFHGERIRVDAAPDVPKVLADPNRIERVLVNLLTNALKYSAPGTPVVVRARADDGALHLEVEDCGQGIAAEDLPRLFERYFRAVGSSRLEGMGLGLYTSRMLVEAHGGTISAASVPGKGSVFEVRLPLPPAGS